MPAFGISNFNNSKKKKKSTCFSRTSKEFEYSYLVRELFFNRNVNACVIGKVNFSHEIHTGEREIVSPSSDF